MSAHSFLPTSSMAMSTVTEDNAQSWLLRNESQW